MSVVVRQARAEELARVDEVTVTAYLADRLLPPDHHYLAELRDAARRAAAADVLVAVEPSALAPVAGAGPVRDAGTVLGTVTLATAGSEFAEVAQVGEVEVRMLAVDPPARGRGVGEQLVRDVVARARAAGASRVVLTTLPAMTAAGRLYERLGFERAPERDWSVEGYELQVHVLDLVAEPVLESVSP